MARGVDKADVVAALSAERVLAHFSIDHTQKGRELRFQICPKCGPRTRADAVSVSKQTGKWRDHAHKCKGDILSMVAGFASLDPARDFERVLALAADVAGIPTSEDPAVLEAFRAEIERRRAKAAEDERQAQWWREKRQREAAGIWERLLRHSDAGLDYMARRCVVRGLPDVRFGKRALCLPLRDGEGTIVNVVGRLFVEPTSDDDPKVYGLAGCTSKGTFGDIRKADSTEGPVVIVEGFMDWLSARVAWPTRLILGAHGGGNLDHVAELAALVATARGALIVPHQDEAGGKDADKAIAALIRAGVPVEDIECFVVQGIANDLNDALMAGRVG